MTSATCVVDESHLDLVCRKVNVRVRIVRVCVLWHAAKETKEGSSRTSTQDLLQK